MQILRIKELLKEKGISGKQLAQELGVTENSISLILNNKRQPRFETLADIAKVLDVDIRELFYSTKETQSDTLYIKKDGEFVAVGKLLKN